jgi:hypothetical protein
MEVRDDHHGSYVGISQKKEKEWCNMGHSRPLDEIRTIPGHKDDQFDRQACQDLHKQGGATPRDFSIHCLGLRF